MRTTCVEVLGAHGSAAGVWLVGVPLRGSVLMSMQLEVRLVGVPLRGTVLFGAMRRPRPSADGLATINKSKNYLSNSVFEYFLFQKLRYTK